MERDIIVNSDGGPIEPSSAPAVDHLDTAEDDPNFLIEEDRNPVDVADVNDDDDDEEDDDETGEPVNRSANGMPSMGYTDEQMLTLMNLISEHRVYVKSTKRFSQKPVKAKWEDVAKYFFATWTNIKVLKGPGLKKSYTRFDSDFISFIHDDHSNLSALNDEPVEWQQTLINLEEKYGSIKQKMNAAKKAKKQDLAKAMQERENVILGRKDPGVIFSNDNDTSGSGSPSDPISAVDSNSKSSSKRRHSDVEDISEFALNYKMNQDRFNDIREEEIRTNARLKEEESRIRLLEIEKKAQATAEELSIKRMEVEARMMEARNKERELKMKEAYDLQILELLKSNIRK